MFSANAIAGPSTPSKKRSRWESSESTDLNQATVDPYKKRTKSKAKSSARLDDNDSNSRNDNAFANTVTGLQQAGSVTPQSRYVPQRTAHPPFLPSRSVYCYERLNQIEEGSYGVVFRARDKQSGDIVALKKLKLEEEKNGFPITSLREINALIACRHENVVRIREVVVGETLTQ